MKLLIWQWGRHGAGPRFAACLADSLRNRPEIAVRLSLCQHAEIMLGPNAPCCEMPVRTYRGIASFLCRFIAAPIAVPLLLIKLRRNRPDLAICAMPGPLDLVMALALRLLRVKMIVVVHEVEPRPGDGFSMQLKLQNLLCRCADALVVLSKHVGSRPPIVRLTSVRRPLISFMHPPFVFDSATGVRAPGPHRLLFFGRLLPYKGLDLLASAIALLPPSTALAIRVVGFGPDSPELDALRACRGVIVENRWVPETEIGALLSWADAMVLPYREASQSGVAAVAIGLGCPVIATQVGGLPEQLSGVTEVVMCDPEPASLACGISRWLEAPFRRRHPLDGAEVWRQAGSTLLLALKTVLPVRDARNRPSQTLAKLKITRPAPLDTVGAMVIAENEVSCDTIR